MRTRLRGRHSGNHDFGTALRVVIARLGRSCWDDAAEDAVTIPAHKNISPPALSLSVGVWRPPRLSTQRNAIWRRLGTDPDRGRGTRAGKYCLNNFRARVLWKQTRSFCIRFRKSLRSSGALFKMHVITSAGTQSLPSRLQRITGMFAFVWHWQPAKSTTKGAPEDVPKCICPLHSQLIWCFQRLSDSGPHISSHCLCKQHGSVSRFQQQERFAVCTVSGGRKELGRETKPSTTSVPPWAIALQTIKMLLRLSLPE